MTALHTSGVKRRNTYDKPQTTQNQILNASPIHLPILARTVAKNHCSTAKTFPESHSTRDSTREAIRPGLGRFSSAIILPLSRGRTVDFGLPGRGVERREAFGA